MSGVAPVAAGRGAGVSRSASAPGPPPSSGEAALPQRSERARGSWRVRAAARRDAPAVAAAVGELLRELGGAPPPTPAMKAAALELLGDREAGAVLVAEAGGAGSEAGNVPRGGPLIGVLGASWQVAIHTPGRYALIQDLWVDPSWRGAGVGGGLLTALFKLARLRELTYVEVGLPRERFAGLAATEAFYVAAGFTALGARMRRSLA